MASTVYWGSPRQSKLDANETLPAKLDLILDKLHLRDRVKKELVVLKISHGFSHWLFNNSSGVFAKSS